MRTLPLFLGRMPASVRRFSRRCGGLVLDLLYPRFCPACVAPSRSLGPCGRCAARLRAPRAPLCPRCGLCAGVGAEPGQACPTCLREPWFRGRVAAPFLYTETAGALVRALKFRRHAGAGVFLGRAMARAARVARLPLGTGVLVVPVPLHPKKLRRRGIHQAGELARVFARHTGARMVEALYRTRETEAQGRVAQGSRRDNVAGAFATHRSFRGQGLARRLVLLVDDVATSGATARECRRVLLQAGAASVDLVTACLAGPGP